MRQPQNVPVSDFDAGVQAGLKTAATLLERLAEKVQKPGTTPPASAPEHPRPGPRGVTSRRTRP